MSDEDGELNYAKIAGALPMPSRLDGRVWPQYVNDAIRIIEIIEQ